FVEREASRIEARFVCLGRRNRARPSGHPKQILRRGCDVAHGPAAAGRIRAGACEARNVRAKGQCVLLRNVEIDARIKLIAATYCRNGKLRELDIGNAVWATATQITERNVLSLSAGQATNVQAARELPAIGGVIARERASHRDYGNNSRRYA